MSIKEIQEEIIDEFSMFDDWMQRYEYIIDLGKNLPLIQEEFKTDDNIIKGCQSKVWLKGEQNDDKIVFTAEDAEDAGLHEELPPDHAGRCAQSAVAAGSVSPVRTGYQHGRDAEVPPAHRPGGPSRPAPGR